MSLKHLIESYADTPDSHRAMWEHCLAQVNADQLLTRHRDYIEQGLYGYGDRPYHYAWKCLVDALPAEFSFLEVGVFQGQVLSLVKLLALRAEKVATVVGVTPLSTDGDHVGSHPSVDYLARIRQVHSHFNLPSPVILKGMSFDPRIKRLARERGPYDMVYIDGCHDYDVVVDDILSYAPRVKPGGYLVIDDAGNDLSIPDGLIPTDFKGIEDVTRAMNDALEARDIPYFPHLFAVGHVRVFTRV